MNMGSKTLLDYVYLKIGYLLAHQDNSVHEVEYNYEHTKFKTVTPMHLLTLKGTSTADPLIHLKGYIKLEENNTVSYSFSVTVVTKGTKGDYTTINSNCATPETFYKAVDIDLYETVLEKVYQLSPLNGMRRYMKATNAMNNHSELANFNLHTTLGDSCKMLLPVAINKKAKLLIAKTQTVQNKKVKSNILRYSN